MLNDFVAQQTFTEGPIKSCFFQQTPKMAQLPPKFLRPVPVLKTYVSRGCRFGLFDAVLE